MSEKRKNRLILSAVWHGTIGRSFCGSGSECKKLTDRQNSRIRSKRYRDKKRRELEQAKKTAENLQDEVTELRMQIQMLRNMVN